MGCCCSLYNPSLNPEVKVCEIEDKLEIKVLSAERVDKMIYRYSKSLKVSQAQFKVFCNELPLEKDSFSCAYFKMFYNEECDYYNVKELSSAAILYCYGSDEEKIKLLFQNYDDDSSKTISSNELKQIISDLTNIVLSYSTNFAILNSSKSLADSEYNLLTDYRKELISIRPIIMSYYNSFILENYPESIKLNEFQTVLMKKEINSLISPHKMRELCFRFKQSLSKTVELVQKIMEDPESVDKSITRRLTMRLSSEKSLKSSLSKRRSSR